jgi:hypothetical protein
VLVRIGDTIHAMHAVCAHAGGPLAEGTVVDGCVECPWHGSRFRLEDGRARRGPTVYDQPAYEIRAPKRAATRSAARRPRPEDRPPTTGGKRQTRPTLITRVEIVVADPSLIVLVGAAGSGKSTFAGRHFAPGRGPILGRVPGAHRRRRDRPARHEARVRPAPPRAQAAMAAGQLTVVDATNIEPAPGEPS